MSEKKEVPIEKLIDEGWEELDVEQLKKLIEQRVNNDQIVALAETKKNEIVANIKSLLARYPEVKITSSLGTLQMVRTERVTYSGESLTQALLGYGMDSDAVKQIMDAAGKKSVSESANFYKSKKGD